MVKSQQRRLPSKSTDSSNKKPKSLKRSAPVLLIDSDSEGDDHDSSSSSLLSLTPRKPAPSSSSSSSTTTITKPTPKPPSNELVVASTTTNTNTNTNTTANKTIHKDSYDIVLPASLGAKSGDCTVLVQMDHNDATLLQLDGASGAIGRLEVDEYELTLDLKGYQFAGQICPGPSVLVATINKAGMLKVDGLTDEFVQMIPKRKRGLDAVVTGDTDGNFHRNIAVGQDDDDDLDDDDRHNRHHKRKGTKDDNVDDDDDGSYDSKQKEQQLKETASTKKKMKSGGPTSSSQKKKATGSTARKRKSTKTKGPRKTIKR